MAPSGGAILLFWHAAGDKRRYMYRAAHAARCVIPVEGICRKGKICYVVCRRSADTRYGGSVYSAARCHVPWRFSAGVKIGRS